VTDRRLDPRTGDYVDDGRGNWEMTDTAATAILHQLRGHKAKWVLDPDVGSRLHELDRAKSTVKTPAVIEDMFRAALAPLVAEGRIDVPEVRAALSGSALSLIADLALSSE
jgi:phage gp46-like protein